MLSEFLSFSGLWTHDGYCCIMTDSESPAAPRQEKSTFPVLIMRSF